MLIPLFRSFCLIVAPSQSENLPALTTRQYSWPAAMRRHYNIIEQHESDEDSLSEPPPLVDRDALSDSDEEVDGDSPADATSGSAEDNNNAGTDGGRIVETSRMMVGLAPAYKNRPFHTNSHIIKVGVRASYGFHQDTSSIDWGTVGPKESSIVPTTVVPSHTIVD